MNKKSLLTAAFMVAGLTAAAQDVQVSNVQIERTDSKVIVQMDMDLSAMAVGNNRIKTVTPRLKNGNDSIDLKSVGVYGRSRYYYTQRNPERNPLQFTDVQLRTAQAASGTIQYQDIIEALPWMYGAKLYINNKVYGCVSCLLADSTQPTDYLLPQQVLPEPEPYKPHFVYLRPQAEAVKIRQIDATAYVNFRVNKTDIDPAYMKNRAELAKIISSIEEVKNGNKVTGISMKGFASPEGTYASNERLAKGRVEAIRKYVADYEHMPANMIQAGYEPENWEGLRAYVAESSLNSKQAILDIIDSDREPDNKEFYLKSHYPAEYKQLLADCYPSLRRTDYSIHYEVQHYTEIDEIKKVFREAPQNLSLEELYVLAHSYLPGSAEFQEVFIMAVRLFPNDPVANLNAAIAAMEEGQLTNAATFLQKAGNSAEAQAARELLKELQEHNWRPETKK